MLIRVVYTILLTLLSPLLLLQLYKKKEGKPPFGKRWKEHFGITPAIKGNAPLWIHAVSVGEAIAATILIKAIKQHFPQQAIVVTTTTSTGAQQIERLGNLVEHRYMPIDFAFAVRGFLNAVKPQKMIIIETELWPNTLATVAQRGIPVIVVNARLSKKSQYNYAKIKPVFNLLSRNITKILCQSQQDADNFAALGISDTKLVVTGSIKYDIQIDPQTLSAGKDLRAEIGVQRRVWIAASTHAGEDEQILAAHKELLKDDAATLLILVPRHPERFDAMFTLAQQLGFTTTRRTTGKVTAETQVYLADTMGEMLLLLSAADICFMGGSLIGNKVGGHNLLEPAALGIPCINGPSYFNFREITQQLHAAGAVELIENSQQLGQTLLQLFAAPEKMHHMAQQGIAVVAANRGAIKATLNALDQKNHNQSVTK